MGGNDQRIQSRPVDARSSALPGVPSIFVDDLNEIGTFGYSVINPGLRTLGPSKSWELQSVFRAVATRSGRDVTGGKQIRAVTGFVCILFGLLGGSQLQVHQHGDVCRDTKDSGLLQVTSGVYMRMRVDQPRN